MRAPSPGRRSWASRARRDAVHPAVTAFFALPRAGRGGPEHGSAAATPHGIVRSEGPDRKPSGRCRRMRKRRIPSRGEGRRAFHTSTGLPPATPRSRRPGDASVAGAGVPFCLFPSGFSTPGAESGPRRPVPERRSAAAGGRPAGRAKAARFPDCPEFPPKTAGNGCTIAGSQVRAKEKTLSDGIPPAEPLQRSLLRAYGPPLKASNAASPTFP